MKLKKMTTAIAAAAMLSIGGVGAVTSAAHATAGDAVLIRDVDHALAVHRAGGVCSKAVALSSSALARTKWSTVILCHPYITSRGRVAFHYTYVRVDFSSNPGDVYTSDGWVIPGAWMTTALRMAH